MKCFACVLVLIIGLVSLSCRQRDIRTTVIKCPQVRNAQSAKLVTMALARMDGVLADSITVKDGVATVTYDSMKVAVKNLDFSIAEAGFDADEIPADKKAREALPADCK